MPSRVGRGRRAAVDFVVCFGWGGEFFGFFFSSLFFIRTHTACCKHEARLLPYLSTSTGVRTGCHYLISLSACPCMCNICESCTRPISTNPGSMGAGEYWLTRGTYFVSRHLELVAVAGLLWISWCVLGAADFSCFFFFRFSFFFERTRPAASMRPPCLIYLSTSNEAVFCFKANKASSYRGSYGRLYLISLPVCLCMCNIRRFY